MSENQEKPLHKFELSHLLFDVFGPSLFFKLTGIHPEKALRHIFGVPAKTLPPKKIPWTDAETKRLRFLLELIKAIKGPYDYSKFPGTVNNLVNKGICQWFRLPRTQLDGKKPGDFLYKTDWDPDQPMIQVLLTLAKGDGDPSYKNTA